MSMIFLGDPAPSIKRWMMNYDPAGDKLRLVVQTTSSYKKSGIYSAARDDAGKPVVIDWGDGTVEQVDGDVSQKVHEYSSAGTFDVVVENVKSYAASIASYNWYSTTSQNRYTLKEVVAMPDGVTRIENSAFYDCAGLTSVAIPDSVTGIGDSAFSGCTGLTSVAIPDSVTSIGNGTFSYCYGLTGMTIPDGVTSIGDNVFFYCTGLAGVTIPDGVTSIGTDAFSGCTGLTSVTIPDGVTSIGNGTFSYCYGLTSMTIPYSVTSIGTQAFYGCDSLLEIWMTQFFILTVEQNALDWGVGIGGSGKHAVVVYCMDGTVVVNGGAGSSSGEGRNGMTVVDDIYGNTNEYDIQGEFSGTVSVPNFYDVTSIRFGTGVTGIGDCSYNYNLNCIDVPSSVGYINILAFQEDTALQSISIRGTPSIGTQAFYGCDSLLEIWATDMYCYDFERNALDWGVGIGGSGKHAVVVYCMDGTVVVNGGAGSSGSGS